MNKLIKYTVATLLMSVPLYPKFPLFSIPGTFVSVRLEDLLLVFALLVLMLRLIINNDFVRIVKNGITQSILLYLAVGFVSLLSAILITNSINPSIGILHWLRRIEYFVPFFLGLYSMYSDEDNLSFFTNILLVVMLAMFVYGFGQKEYSWPIIITQNEEYSKGAALRYVPGGHINSTFAGHYDLGTFLVMVLPLFACLIAVYKGWVRYLYGLGFFGGLWLLVSSASRVSLASYLFSTVFALVLVRKKLFIPIVLLTTLMFTFSSDNLMARYRRIIDVTTQGIKQLDLLNYVIKDANAQSNNILPDKKDVSITPTSVPVFEDRSSNIRLNVEWPRAIRAFYKNPLLGTGYSSITLATDNDYLRLLGEVGVLGFVAFMIIILRLVIVFLKSAPFGENFTNLELVYIISMFATIPGILINALFIDVFEASKFALMFWLMLGIAVGILINKKKYEF